MCEDILIPAQNKHEHVTQFHVTNTSIDYMSIGAFKAEGQWYIIK